MCTNASASTSASQPEVAYKLVFITGGVFTLQVVAYLATWGEHLCEQTF